MSYLQQDLSFTNISCKHRIKFLRFSFQQFTILCHIVRYVYYRKTMLKSSFFQMSLLFLPSNITGFWIPSQNATLYLKGPCPQNSLFFLAVQFVKLFLTRWTLTLCEMYQPYFCRLLQNFDWYASYVFIVIILELCVWGRKIQELDTIFITSS